MLKKPLIAANWKLNLNPKEATAYFEDLKKNISSSDFENLAFFPPTIDLQVTSEQLKNTPAFWGSQNVYTEISGAFTGENSVEMVKSLGANMCLVGHSERRTYFKETDEEVAKKVQLIQKHEMIPMICVGESLVQRDSGKTFEILNAQMRTVINILDENRPFVIAYEPVWAIGTGKVATPEIAEEAHQFIRSQLSELLSKEVAQEVLLLYGGSVKPENAAELYKQPNIDGFLVGGASLKVDTFLQIYKATI
ncbi:MAG: triose-phosphate isomerase [Bdellovibrionales bacterium]|nr:triose-phosphate isomerase [Bdellovibrionales bacterium]